MTEQNLATLLRDHVRATEPPTGLDPGAAILSGRRALRRRRARRGVAAVLAVGTAAAVAVPVLGAGDRPDTRLDPATEAALADYDAAAMPDVLGRAADPLVRPALPGIVDQRAFAAYDDQGEKLPKRHWDKASSMELTYGGEGPHRFRVSLLHARSEAEGDAREYCRDELASGYAFRCFVTTKDGDTVTNSITAVRKDDRLGGWSAITRAELRTGRPVATNPSQEPIDPDEVYFLRTVESVHSDTFLTVAQEVVRAPDLATANDAWALTDLGLQGVVTDPSLVMPEPPLGKGGCGWTWKADVTCE